MYIDKYWGNFIGGSDDSLNLVYFLEDQKKEEISLGEIFTKIGLDKQNWDFHQTVEYLEFTHSDGVEVDFHFAIDLITDLAAIMLECSVSGSVDLHKLDEYNTPSRRIRITATAEEHDAMNKALSDFVKDPLSYDLHELMDDEDMLEMAQECEEIRKELYESAGRNRNYHVKAEDMKNLLPDWEEANGCIATNRITVEGCKVGYCYRDKPDGNWDSGWRFTAGDESDEYMDDPNNAGIYGLNTICNDDPEIIPLLNAPCNSAFERDENGVFQPIKDWKPGETEEEQNMELLKQCKQWFEKNEAQKVIDTLEAIPAEERTPELDSELAKAYIAVADIGEREPFEKALELLAPHEEYFAEDHCWNYRIALAYYCLDEEGPALRYFEKALKALPGDKDTQEYIDDCRRRLSLPRFEKNFRERTQEAWAAFSQIEAELRQIMDTDEMHQRGDELIEKCGNALKTALRDTSFELGFNGEKYELILAPEGDKVKLFELVYFQKHVPEKVLEHWNILVGRQPIQNIGLRTDNGWEISGDDVQIWLEEQGENSFAISAYCEKLLPMLREEEGRVWWMLTTLTDQVLGEISHMRYIGSFDVLEEPKAEPSMLMSQLPDSLKERGLEFSTDPNAYLESYLGYEMKPNEDPDADWRLDTIVGSTNCVPLINDYLNNESDYIDNLHADGAVAGFFCYPLDTLREEEGSEKIFDFRDKLEELFTTGDGPEVLTLTGGATGIYCGYVDFIAWDLRTVLNMAKEFFEDSDIPWASFHTFRREAGTVSLKNPNNDPDTDVQEDEMDEIEPDIHEETGSLLSAEDIEILESFDEGTSGYFGRMLQWLEDFIKNGVEERRFTEKQAHQDLQIALWYAFACNNIDDYIHYYQAAEWMKYSEKNAAGCATWYYRYSAALMYCGRLEEALNYAEKGAREEPDYPWIWLQVGKLRAHFGDKAGALDAVEQGLKLEPGDYEFLTLQQEIKAGAPLEQMEYHWINPDADQTLQQGLDESADDKQLALACIQVDEAGLAEFYELFRPERYGYEKNSPCCEFQYPVKEHLVELSFRMNEAGLSKMGTDWLRQLKDQLDNGKWLTYTPEGEPEGILVAVFVEQTRRIILVYQQPGDDQYFNIFIDSDGSECSADQYTCLSRSSREDESDEESEADHTGVFTGFVLLSEAEWDKAQFIRDMKEKWDITIEEDEDKSDDAVVFEVGDMIAAVSLMPYPIPNGEAELNAENNYMWSDAVKVAKEHSAHIIVAVLGNEENVLEKGKLYTKLVAACCRQKYTTGVYTSGVVFEPRFYEGFADMMKEDELPIFNWIWFGLYRNENRISGYTYGMDVFGKDEMEVLDTDADPESLRDFLSSLVSYVLEYDVELHDGETIGFTADDKHTITRSPGVSLPEEHMTLKISYEPTEGDPVDEDDIVEMDDAFYHIESIEEKELDMDPINAYNHMAIYLRWCMEHEIMSEDFLKEYGEVAKQVKADPDSVDLREFIRDELDGQLFSALFNDVGEKFASYYYGEADSPYFPSDIDNYAFQYFGSEKYHSDEFQDEAYLFVPFDEEYYQAMAKVIERRFVNWQGQDFDEDTLEPSELAKAMMNYLDCECTYFPSMKDDDPIMSAYSYAKRESVKEGFVPVLIKADDEILWECLVMNSDPDSDGEDDYAFNPDKVAEYRKNMLAAPIKDGKAVLQEFIDQRKEEAEDDDMDWKEILGEIEGGYDNCRFASYWNYGTDKTSPIILAKIPVKNPWEIFAYLPFGNWNECPDTPELMAVAKYWFEKYGAVPATMSHDELEFDLSAPVSKENAMEVAEEQYGFCPDIVDQEQEDPTIGNLADVLWQSTVWYFWWD